MTNSLSTQHFLTRPDPYSYPASSNHLHLLNHIFIFFIIIKSNPKPNLQLLFTKSHIHGDSPPSQPLSPPPPPSPRPHHHHQIRFNRRFHHLRHSTTITTTSKPYDLRPSLRTSQIEAQTSRKPKP